MISFPQAPKVLKKNNNKATFEIQGLYPGYGVTIGSALRRVLISSLDGVAVTEVKIKGVAHEFSIIPGVLEDVIMIILNIKNLRFKIHEGQTQTLELFVKGEKEVKGSDFKKSPQVELANPELHIATITDKKTELNMEITIEKGIGYEPKEHRKIKKEEGGAQSRAEIGAIALDAIFTPIKNVNFNVENMRVGERTDFDKLSLEIETDGTIMPEEAFYQACDILIKHFTLLFGQGLVSTKEELQETAESDPSKKVIEDLKFSTRTLNALVSNNIKTVGGILRKSEKALLKLEGMGDKAISEIKKKLKKLNLELKGE